MAYLCLYVLFHLSENPHFFYSSTSSMESFWGSTLKMDHLDDQFLASIRSEVSCGSESSSPRDSTVSSDSGHGSTTTMQLEELRVDSPEPLHPDALMDSLKSGNTDTLDCDSENIYETIPDHLVSDEGTSDSDGTLCGADLGSSTMSSLRLSTSDLTGGITSGIVLKQFPSMNVTYTVDNVDENTYATIECDDTLCDTFTNPPPLVAPQPPARNPPMLHPPLHFHPIYPSRSPEPVKGRRHTRGYGVLERKQRIKTSDIIDSNPYHTYTVADVLESFERLSANIPSSVPENQYTKLHKAPAVHDLSQSCTQSDTETWQRSKDCVVSRRDIKPDFTQSALNRTDLNNNLNTSRLHNHNTSTFSDLERNSPLNHRVLHDRTNQLSNVRQFTSSVSSVSMSNVDRNRTWNSQCRKNYQLSPLARTMSESLGTVPKWSSKVAYMQGTLC